MLRFFLLLQGPHLRVRTVTLQKLAMRSAFNDSPCIQNKNLIRVHDSGEPMRDNERGVSGRNSIQLSLDRKSTRLNSSH